ncbi:hypothetical protein ACX9R5_03280 [Rathayibacter sp. CAU 1779]
MPQYTVTEVRNAGRSAAMYQPGGAREVLRKAAGGGSGSYDIFLSHSYLDAELVLGVRAVLQKTGKTVYVDWIDDPQLDRSRVSPATAMILRRRMTQCRSLVYALTPAASSSKWMPWELGFFDGYRGRESVAIMPLVDESGRSLGQEYLQLYPSIDRDRDGVPVVTKVESGGTLRKSVDALVNSMGGTAWRNTF